MKNINKNILLGLFFCLGCLSSCFQSTNHEHSQKIVSSNQDKLKLPATTSVVILGGGIAGLTAAIYLAQANIPTIVIEGPKPGGALAQSHAVRNWPGEYNESGANIVQKIKTHAITCGAQIVQARVTAVNIHQNPFIFELDTTKTIKAQACIVAMGTEPNFLNIPGERGENGYWGRGVSNCAICDGFFFKNKHVIVVGGGDSAIEEASYLSPIAKNVTIVVRKDSFRAKDIKARQHLLTYKNVSALFNTQIKKINGDGTKVTSVILTSEDGSKELPADGIFLAIGSRPNTDLFSGQLELDSNGFIVLKNHQETSVPGVFAAGDIADAQFVQAITAAGDGCRAALQVKKYLN